MAFVVWKYVCLGNVSTRREGSLEMQKFPAAGGMSGHIRLYNMMNSEVCLQTVSAAKLCSHQGPLQRRMGFKVILISSWLLPLSLSTYSTTPHGKRPLQFTCLTTVECHTGELTWNWCMRPQEETASWKCGLRSLHPTQLPSTQRSLLQKALSGSRRILCSGPQANAWWHGWVWNSWGVRGMGPLRRCD